MTDKERINVYIDENEDSVRYEEYNEDGELKITLYDEEFECEQEFIHDVKIKGLQSVQNQVAIEQLEKVNSLCYEMYNYWEKTKFKGYLYDEHDISNAYLYVQSSIEELINELKGENK